VGQKIDSYEILVPRSLGRPRHRWEDNVEMGIKWGHVIASWLSHSATDRKVEGSRPDEVNAFFSVYLILPAALGPGVYSASNINEYQKQKNKVPGE
jgi:hypothetical protein